MQLLWKSSLSASNKTMYSSISHIVYTKSASNLTVVTEKMPIYWRIHSYCIYVFLWSFLQSASCNHFIVIVYTVCVLGGNFVLRSNIANLKVNNYTQQAHRSKWMLPDETTRLICVIVCCTSIGEYFPRRLQILTSVSFLSAYYKMLKSTQQRPLNPWHLF